MSKIFISYRRDDAEAYAGRIYDRLAERFSADQIFMDIDNIPLGVDFVSVLQQKVRACKVMLVLIGKDWLSVADDAGYRRLDNPSDFVRLEIVTALDRNIRVIPVLLSGATVPKEHLLPDDLKPLARRNGIVVNHASFRSDIDRLINELERALTPEAAASPPPPPAPEAKPPHTDEASLSETVVQPKVRNWGAIMAYGWGIALVGWAVYAMYSAFYSGRNYFNQTNDKPQAVATATTASAKPSAISRDPLKVGSKEPEMVVIPAGSFLMGSPADEKDRFENEGPQHAVTVGRFALGAHEVTFAEYDAFAEATNRKKPSDEGWGRGNRPVIHVSWDDAQAYAAWLSEKTGKRYRLPTEAEWEYAARAGTTGRFFWGDDPADTQLCEYANGSADCNDGYLNTSPVASFKPNPFGLYDMLGNVWEWVEDCDHVNYQGAPTVANATWEQQDVPCALRVVRGGSWWFPPNLLRSATRYFTAPDDHSDNLHGLGFRLAQDL